MCDPVTAAAIASVALTAASAAAAQNAASQTARARSQAAVVESTRQEGLQRRAIGELEPVTAGFTPEAQNLGIEQAGEERVRRLQSNVESAGDLSATDLPLTGSAPNIVREVAGRELSRGLGEGKAFAAQLGRLGAFGENQFRNRVNLGRLGETLGQVGAESRNSSAIFPLELDTANRAGDTSKGVSDILGALGSGASQFSATGSGTGSALKPLPAVRSDVL